MGRSGNGFFKPHYKDKDGNRTRTDEKPRCQRYGKFCHSTKKAAMTEASRVGKGVTVYKCEICNEWHLTSQEVKDEKRAKQKQNWERYNEIYERTAHQRPRNKRRRKTAHPGRRDNGMELPDAET